MRLDHLLSKEASRGCFAVQSSMFCIGGEVAEQFPMAFVKYGLDEVAQQLPMAFAPRKTIFPVVMRLWDTPVPIPNTMVKT